MPTVSNTVTDPAGDPIAGVQVVVRLIATIPESTPAAGFLGPDDETIESQVELTTDALGEWSTNLVANSLITPAGTYYLVSERPDVTPRRPAVKYRISVPDGAGPYWAGDLLVNAPDDLPSVASDASAVSFNPTGVIAATNVQAAIAELEEEVASGTSVAGEIFVSAAGSDLNNGSTWGLAKATLAGALAVAVAGDTIRFSRGSFPVTADAAVPAAVEIVGRGEWSTIFTVADGVSANVFDVDGVEGVRLRKFAIVGGGNGVAEGNTARAVRIRGAARNVVVERVRAVGLQHSFKVVGQDGTVPGTAQDITFRQCLVTYSGNYGYQVDEADGVTLDNCFSDTTDLDGIKLTRKAVNVAIRGGAYRGSLNGDGLDGYAGGDTLSVSDAVFEDNGINGATIKADDLTRDDAATYGYVRNAMISNIRCRNNAGYGLSISRDGTPDVADVPWPSGHTVHGGVFEGNGEAGILIRGRNYSLFGPICRRNDKAGILIQSALNIDIYAPQVMGNSQVSANTHDGIQITGTVAGGYAKGIRIHGGTSDGADVDTATTEAELAAATKYQRYGVSVAANCDEITVDITCVNNATAPFNNAATGAVFLREPNNRPAQPVVTVHGITTPSATTQGTWVPGISTAVYFASYVLNSGSAQNDNIAWDIRLEEGTYRLDLFAQKSANRAIATVAIADIDDQGTVGAFSTIGTIDLYAAGTAVHKDTTLTGIAVTRAGRKRIRFTAATRNASAAAWELLISGFSLIRTA